MDWIGVAVWVVPMLAISLWVALHPQDHTVIPIYHEAAANWWAHKDLYHGPEGLNYLPHFVILFTPFHVLPVLVGDILWRLLTAALLASGIWHLLRDASGVNIAPMFRWASLLALPACAGALRNGQASALFAALCLHAIACLPQRQWWAAAALMVLALAVRPIGIVMVLLAPFVYAPLRWRLPVLLLAFVAFPFLFAPSDYVISQLHGFAANIQACAAYTRRDFADFNGIIRTLGSELPTGVSNIISLFAGGITLALWGFTAARLREPFRACWLLALTSAYLMLFNPMNEVNSYVILAPALAVWAVNALPNQETRRFGYWVVFLVLTIGVLPEPMRHIFGNNFGPFWHPVATAMFVGLLTSQVWRADLTPMSSSVDNDSLRRGFANVKGTGAGHIRA